MFFVALATDYDGTLAANGVVAPEAMAALQRLRKSGRKVILVTGRQLSDLERVCPELEVFDLIVAENGATLYDPASKDEQTLAPPPSPELVAYLEGAGVVPLSVGRSIVATWEPHETVVLKAIRELGLELHIIFNKGAVMVLPANINKASGLRAALDRLGIAPQNVAGIGDAENDHAFMRLCGCSVAVDNALESIKETVDLVTRGARGDGVVELCDRLCETDLCDVAAVPTPAPLLGKTMDGCELFVDPRAGPLLITGSSGGGKTTTVTTLLERMTELDFQCCILDPEGDYGSFADATAIGTAKNSPTVEEVLSVLNEPDASVVCNLLAVPLADRPSFLAKLLPELSYLRSEAGRPHWIVIDEAHHAMPAESTPVTLPRKLPGLVLVTVSPEALSPVLVEAVETVIGVGDKPYEIVVAFCKAAGLDAPPAPKMPEEGGAVYYRRGDGSAQAIVIGKPQRLHLRHVRKYAEGELGEDRSFYFRGPGDKLKLRAQNLMIFLQMAAGVDDETWLHHLARGDYSGWFETAIKDPELAEEARAVEAEKGLSAEESRKRIEEMVSRRYTAPATKREE